MVNAVSACQMGDTSPICNHTLWVGVGSSVKLGLDMPLTLESRVADLVE